MLSELARLGARLIIQRAVEEEFDTWLGRARYERRPDGPSGKRNGFRPRRVQTQYRAFFVPVGSGYQPEGVPSRKGGI